MITHRLSPTFQPCSQASTLNQDNLPTRSSSQVQSSIDHFMVPNSSVYHGPLTQSSPYETCGRPEASPNSSGQLKPHQSDFPRLRNVLDLTCFTGESSDWHCKSCGTFYTEDVPNCFVLVKISYIRGDTLTSVWHHDSGVINLSNTAPLTQAR